MKYFTTLLSFLLCLTLNAQNGCPGCLIDLPVLPEDTIYLSPAPDGEASVYYEEDISFRMPKSTDPVNANDPSVPAGVGISNVKILAAANLPPGLSWEPNMNDFDTGGGETDGCARICGTPLVSGMYEVEVIVEATVAIVSQTASFSFSIYIAPPTSSNDGFSLTNNSGCGEVSVSFTNNNPSNGLDGFSYLWDFGNGNSTVSEDPFDQIYDEPGVYEITYEVTVDTVGATLTSLTILDDDCGDIIGGADLFVKIKDPSGETVFETSPVSDTPIPFDVNVNLPLTESGAYKLEIRDEDVFNNENCGDIFFTQFDNDTLTDGGTKVLLNIIHPVFSFTTVDTVVVYEQPAPPQINPETIEPLCTGNIIDLVSDYDTNLQWYRDTILLFGDTLPILEVNQPGNYWVTYTSSDGCIANSDPVSIEYIPSPAIPVFTNNNNLLSLNSPEDLPTNYSAQWYSEGVPIPFANDLEYCMVESGEYTLVITNLDNGCASDYTFAYSFNPDFDCTPLSTNETVESQLNLKVYPNPSSGAFNVEFETTEVVNVTLELFDLHGRSLLNNQFSANGDYRTFINQPDLSPGLYFLRMTFDGETVTERVVIE